MEKFTNTLLVYMNPAKYYEDANLRGLVQFSKSALALYRSKGLKVKVVDVTGSACENFIYDAALGEIPLISEKSDIDFQLILLAENGEVFWKYDRIPRAYTLGFAIEKMLGEPDCRKREDFELPYFDHTAAEKSEPVEKGNGFYVANQADYEELKTKTFQPGDEILFLRGQVFHGMFAPKGEGTAEKPIRISSYGIGSRPVINAWRDPGGVVLYNTQGWEIDGVNVTGGQFWGIFVGSDKSDGEIFSDFTIRNCSVYNVGFEWPSRKDDAYSGPICINVYDARTAKMANVHWRNVLIENCETYNTTRGEGIFVCGAYGVATRSENVTVQNCFVHDVGHDGILVMCSKNVLIKDNVAFHTGISPVNVGYSPNSIWTWRCTDAVVTGNDASFAHSPIHGTDGGAFDVDFYNKNNIYEFNYAHDNDTYGIAVFGAGYNERMAEPDEHITSNTIVRFNYFGNNQVVGCGEIYFLTWNGGMVDGFEFYYNFIYSKPKDGLQPAITFPTVEYTGDMPRIFRHNMIYSSTGFFMNMEAADKVVFEDNEYYSDANDLKWKWANGEYKSFADFSAATGNEKSGNFTANKPVPGWEVFD